MVSMIINVRNQTVDFFGALHRPIQVASKSLTKVPTAVEYTLLNKI